jgi:hypothetical protein
MERQIHRWGMANYKLYCLDDGGHIVRRHDIQSADDLSALKEAYKYCGEYSIEIWDGARRVSAVKKGEKQPDDL